MGSNGCSAVTKHRVTECSAVTKQVVAKNGSGTEIVSSSERYKGESEEGGSLIFQMLLMLMMNM